MNQIKLIFLIIWLLAGCKGFNKANRFMKDLTYPTKTIEMVSKVADSLKIYYSGCSGFYFEYAKNGILHDPFLSNNGPLLSLNNKPLEVDSILLNQYFTKIIGTKKDSLGKIKALIASHTHYDHVLDFPYIIKNQLNIDSTLIGGNRGLEALLELNNFTKASLNQKINLHNFDIKASDNQIFNQWIYINNKSIRILPILSDHAPHYYGIKLFKGNIETSKHKIPSKAAHFKEGQSISYIIDFMKAEKPVFRCYIQGSASQFPKGFPPQMIDNKAFDLAILCVASYKYVKGYPEEILNYLKPKHVILAHWENFFIPRTGLYQKPAQVPFTNVKRFLNSYKKSAKKLAINDFTMPISDTEIKFKF